MITGIILASGSSKRMPGGKLLLDVRGMPLVERVIRAAHLSRLDAVMLIYQDDRIKALAEKYGIPAIYNDRAHEGQSAAVKAGIRKADPDTAGFMFMVGDQPYLTPEIINRLIDSFEKEKQAIVVPVYNGQRGNPVIFPSTLKEDLERLQGDSGGRVLIDQMAERVKRVDVDDSLAGIDIDSPEDYQKARQQE